MCGGYIDSLGMVQECQLIDIMSDSSQEGPPPVKLGCFERTITN